jgi:aspartyl-tRNA(Asn)/glutamyl-tRNA(Gln) amidotransferase subunit C
MKVTKEDAMKTAHLARISITEEESEKLAKDLTRILDFFDKIGELNTDDITPANHILEVSNVYREDKVSESISSDEVIKNAPKSFESFITVPKVIDKKEP